MTPRTGVIVKYISRTISRILSSWPLIYAVYPEGGHSSLSAGHLWPSCLTLLKIEATKLPDRSDTGGLLPHRSTLAFWRFSFLWPYSGITPSGY